MSDLLSTVVSAGTFEGNQELRSRSELTAKEVMRKSSMVIEASEDVFSVMKKFEESGYWNLPVVENEIYIGFLSVLDYYIWKV